MTLFKQVALVVSLVFFLIIVMTTIGDFKRSGTFLEGQLQTAAQDMTTTLGIAISSSSAGTDVAAYETLFNAVFDSGYYSSIELLSPEGEIIHKKARQLEIENVPDWFISLVPLWPATGKTQVMQGWLPLGTLRLTLHPGYVYSNLYKNLEASLFWVFILYSFGMLLLWLLLKQILKPLNQVKKQADAIHNNQFVQQLVLPRTPELRRVVEAMNRMIQKVQMIFDDQEKSVSRYQKLLYEDNLTGLGNRKYFITELESAQSEETLFHGSLAVIKINNLDTIKDHYGYKKTDSIILTLANILKKNTADNTNGQCARLADDEFALLLPDSDQEIGDQLKGLFDFFKSSDEVRDLNDQISLSVGVTNIKVGHKTGDTLAESDYALTQASASAPYSVFEQLTSDISLPQGKMQWRNWLEECIKESRFFLVKQNVLDQDNNIIHQEVFVRVKNEKSQTLSAGMFMPMANSLELGESIDRCIFKLLKKLSNRQDDIAIALNLTVSVFKYADLLLEFNELLQYFKNKQSRLCVEASHTIIDQNPLMCAEVAESVRSAGHQFGVDNLNLGLSLQTLQSVRPDYVKVNAKTLYDMTLNQASSGYQALLTLTKALDIRLIAVCVDSQDMSDHLKKLGVTAMQGNLFGEAEEIS